MRIVTLIENLVYGQGLFAEHGLSIYIETEHQKILFDTGQSGLFIQNAQKLGVEIGDIDCLVLSHGHYDHTGGLYPFLKANSKAKVYAKREIFAPKYHGHNRFIGVIQDKELLKNRFVPVNSVTELAEEVFIMPEIVIRNSADTHFQGMYKKVDDKLIPDEFDDELFLVVKQDDQIHIVTACSHRGITNICIKATEYFGLPVGLILGGFHTKNSSADQLDVIMDYFRQLMPKSIGTCHCTGVDKYADLTCESNLDVFYNYTGNIVDL